jgi:Sugar (and other) transporter
LLPSELFPTDVRTETHGIAASFGKLGALTSTLVFSFANNGGQLKTSTIFLVNGYASLFGLLLTILFIPNTGKVTFTEVDRLWETQLLGKPYEGPALEPQNLSIVEALIVYGRKEAFQGGQGRSFMSNLSMMEAKEASEKLLDKDQSATKAQSNIGETQISRQ